VSARAKRQEEVAMRRVGYVGSLVKEIFQFARQNKIYWLLPFMLILGLVILLVVTSQASAPFIYTLF
jgi:predicted histidine transporter YuiF (NhaC family)